MEIARTVLTAHNGTGNRTFMCNMVSEVGFEFGAKYGVHYYRLISILLTLSKPFEKFADAILNNTYAEKFL